MTNESHGIYLDDLANGVSVLNNTVYNADRDITIHSGYNNTVTGNSAYGARTYALYVNEDAESGHSAPITHDNIITGNTFETTAAGATAQYDSSIESSTASFGTFNNIVYCHPNSSFAITDQYISDYTLSAWQTFSGQDLNSTYTTAYCSRPTLTTSAASPVSTSTTTLNGNISSNGYASSTIRGFAYGTDSALASVIATTTESGTFGTGTFTANISSLTASTTYYYRAYAVNSAGTSTGAILSTTTLPWSSPGAPTGASAATSSPNQATVSFTPGSNGGSAILYYLASSTPGNFTATSTGSPIVVSGLTNGTAYTFAVYAVNTLGTSSPSGDSNAVTPRAGIGAPTLTTSAPTLVASSTMTLNATITATGGADATASGFAYGTVADLSTVIATTSDGSQSGTASFFHALSSLTPNTLYYFRAYAVNSAGTSTGAILSTTTLPWSSPDAPTGVTAATSSPNQATVSFSGPGSNGGSAILYYLASSTPGNFTATSTGSPIVVTGLTNGTAYTFAVYAVNAVGTSSPSTASNAVTPTDSVLPTYTIGGTISGLNGTVTLQNNAGDNKSISADGPFTFSTSISDGSTYHVTVLTQPSGQTCSVSSGSGTASSGDVTSVSVTCTDNSLVPTPTPTPTPTPVTISYSSGGGGGSVYIPPVTLATTTATTTCQTLMYPIITKNLSLGMTGNDVLFLQKILALEKVYAASSTSGTYGPQTLAAVSSFQKINSIVISGTPETTGFGNVGPKTRSFINQLISRGKYPSLGKCLTSAPALNTPTDNVRSYKFTRSLTLGSIGSDVKALQVFLNTQGFILASTGAGSPGNETTYFGPATKAALMKFQKDHGITPTGFFGPITRTAIGAAI